MANNNDFPPITDFSVRFAAEFKGWMSANHVTQMQLATYMGRTQPYISERVNGRRAISTDEVDALASLTGVTGKDLIIELSKRAHVSLQPNVTQLNVGSGDEYLTAASHDEGGLEVEDE